MIRAAIGQATLPPCSPPCTITAMVYLGLSKGAQQTNQEIVSCRPLYFAWAVPVLPATCTPDKRALLPVPPSAFTTFQNPCRSNSISAGENSQRGKGLAFGLSGGGGFSFFFPTHRASRCVHLFVPHPQYEK